MGQFESTVKAWQQSVTQGLEVRQKRIAKAVFDYCIELSPVRTGRYRASWRIGVGQLDTTSVPRLPESYVKNPMSPAEAISAAEVALKTYKLGDSFYVTNNVPYAAEIERGSSTQAPRGVLAIAAGRAVMDVQGGKL